MAPATQPPLIPHDAAPDPGTHEPAPAQTRAGAARFGLIECDLDAGTVRWDAGAYAALGIAPPAGPAGGGAAAGTSEFRDLAAHAEHARWALRNVHAEDRAALRARLDPAGHASPGESDWPFRVLQAGGPVRRVRLLTDTVPDAQGRALRWRALLVPDLSAPGPAPEHEVQRRMYERAALIGDAAGIGLWTRDLDSGTLYWSNANRALYGLGPDDTPPSWDGYLAGFVHPEDRERFVAEAALADRAGQPVRHADYRVRTADGRERWIYSWSAREVRNGRRIAFGVNVDVTDRHVAEQERRQRERAEQARRAQSDLLARVSHELRTPLNAVLGFADLLANDAKWPLAAPQAQRIDHIRSAGRHLLGLINDLLGLATIDADTREPQWQPVSLADTVAHAVAWVQSLAERTQVHIQVDDPPQGWVRADSRWLLQVAVNLLTNAIKFNRAAGWVRITTPQREVEGVVQRGLMVRDSGQGIDRAQLGRLFEPFERLDAESRGIAGSGLGLAIVRRVVERMGGEVVVHSVPGEGSEFGIWLQACHEEAPPHRAPPLPAAAADSPPFDVLYIEDNATNRELIAAVLQLRPGITLRSADDGASGLAAAQARVPDLVLLDMQLPDLHGLDVLHRLRAQPALARCKIIALSANALPEDRRAALAAGFDDYWTKPIDFPSFLQGIDALVAGAAAGPAARP